MAGVKGLLDIVSLEVCFWADYQAAVDIKFDSHIRLSNDDAQFFFP